MDDTSTDQLDTDLASPGARADTQPDTKVRALRGIASPLSPRRVESQVRAALATRRRIEGWTWQRIADDVGYENPSNARRAVGRLLKDIPQRLIEEELSEALERLDDLYAKQSAQSDDPAAARAALAIIKERANLLGMHAPQKFQINTQHAIEVTDAAVDFADLMNEVAGRYALASGGDHAQPALEAQLVEDDVPVHDLLAFAEDSEPADDGLDHVTIEELARRDDVRLT